MTFIQTYKMLAMRMKQAKELEKLKEKEEAEVGNKNRKNSSKAKSKKQQWQTPSYDMDEQGGGSFIGAASVTSGENNKGFKPAKTVSYSTIVNSVVTI